VVDPSLSLNTLYHSWLLFTSSFDLKDAFFLIVPRMFHGKLSYLFA
jgi:hypothetical protein